MSTSHLRKEVRIASGTRSGLPALIGATLRKHWATYAVVILITVLLAALADIYILDYGVSYREVIVTLMAVAGVSVFVVGSRGLKVGLVFLVMTFGLGYRTMDVTPNLHVHPAELILWALLALPIVQPGILRRRRAKIWLPIWLILFIPFWIWAWVTGLTAGLAWSHMFNEFRNFALLVPLFFVTEMVLADRTSWHHILLAFYLVSTWIAAMGALEYLFPGIKDVFPAFISQPEAQATAAEGFARATFSFWGTPAASFMLVLTAPIATVMWRWWSRSYQRILTILALAVQVFGIYIGGYRSMWMVVGIELGVFAMLRRKPLLAAISLLLPLVSSWLLPSQAQERVLSVMFLFGGNPQDTDSSGIKRLGRISEAINEALDKPLGQGWAAAGWVHNDFLQVAANLGIVAGLLFAGAVLFTVLRLWRRVTATSFSDDHHLGLALLLSFIAGGAVLGMEGVEVLPQLVLPVWFVWVLVEVWLRQTSRSMRIFNRNTRYINTSAGLAIARRSPRWVRRSQAALAEYRK